MVSVRLKIKLLTIMGALFWVTSAHSLPGKAPTIVPTVVVEGLDHPWSLEFLADGRMLVSERSGNIRIIDEGKLGDPIKGMPDIWVVGQGGLLDLAVNGDWIYFSYSEPHSIPLMNSTAVARGKLKANNLTEVEVIFSQKPKYLSRAHFGSRLVFDKDGMLFVTLGDRFTAKDDAQTLDNHHGKVVRISPKGGAARGNPCWPSTKALAEIWTMGHRNIQGATLHPGTGELWIHEHGPQGGDEINIAQGGKNYGWPVITYGESYGGGKIGEGTAKPGLEQPIHYWVPSIAPSGMVFYTGDAYPHWKGDLFVGSLKFRQLVRLKLDGKNVLEEQRLFQKEIGERIRDVVQGPDQLLYLVTDSNNGKVIRLDPVK